VLARQPRREPSSQSGANLLLEVAAPVRFAFAVDQVRVAVNAKDFGIATSIRA